MDRPSGEELTAGLASDRNVSSTRVAVAVVVAVSLAGCLGAVPVVGPDDPTVAVENRSTVPYAVTVTVVDSAEPIGDVPVDLRYRNGTTRRVPYAAHSIGIDGGAFDAPPNVTGLRLAATTVERWHTALAPGENASTVLDDWRRNDLVLVIWTRLDAGNVTYAHPVSCRGSFEYEGRVENARGGGSSGTLC